MHNDYHDIIVDLRSSEVHQHTADDRSRNRTAMALRAAFRAGVSVDTLSETSGLSVAEVRERLDEGRVSDAAVLSLELA